MWHGDFIFLASCHSYLEYTQGAFFVETLEKHSSWETLEEHCFRAKTCLFIILICASLQNTNINPMLPQLPSYWKKKKMHHTHVADEDLFSWTLTAENLSPTFTCQQSTMTTLLLIKHTCEVMTAVMIVTFRHEPHLICRHESGYHQKSPVCDHPHRGLMRRELNNQY